MIRYIVFSIALIRLDALYTAPPLFNTIESSSSELSYHFGKYISLDDDYIQYHVLLPFSSPMGCQTSIDLRSSYLTSGKWATSAGLLLDLLNNNNNYFGINLFYDLLLNKHNHTFHQIGFGGEWIACNTSININAYLPVGNTCSRGHKHTYNDYGDGYYATCQERELAFGGFDTLIRHCLLKYCSWELHTGAGPYYYKNTNFHLIGVLGTLEYYWSDILSIELRLTYDNTYSINAQGVIDISMPLGIFCSRRIACYKDHSFSKNRLRRNSIILTDRCCHWDWNW